MFNNRTVKAQTARRNIWSNLMLTLLIAAFAMVLIPFSYEDPVTWFIGISTVTYVFVYFGLALRTKITIDKKSKYTLIIPDHHSNTNQRIPLEWITSVEVCEYRLFKKDNYFPTAVNNDYYSRKTMPGYIGSGLIVCYRLPEDIAGETIIRGIKFPAPKAEEFSSIINANMVSL